MYVVWWQTTRTTVIFILLKARHTSIISLIKAMNVSGFPQVRKIHSRSVWKTIKGNGRGFSTATATFSGKQDISWLLDKAISSFHFMQALKHIVQGTFQSCSVFSNYLKWMLIHAPAPWPCQASRDVRPAGPGCWLHTWSGIESRRPVTESSGSCMLGTGKRWTSALRDRWRGAPLSPTKRGKFTCYHQWNFDEKMSWNAY